MSQSKQYVGLDVSLKETSICVIDDVGKIVWRGRTESTPEAIASAVKQHAPHAVRIGLESGQLSSWLFHGLKVAGLPVICIDARHAKAALSLKVNKTDANDAFGLAQIMRVGWYREVTVKSLDCQAVRALLVARAQIVSQITTLKNCVRGILKTFGRVLPKGLRSQFAGRVRAAIDVWLAEVTQNATQNSCRFYSSTKQPARIRAFDRDESVASKHDRSRAFAQNHSAIVPTEGLNRRR